MLKYLFTLTTLAGFLWLAQYSLHQPRQTLASFTEQHMASYEQEKTAMLMNELYERE